MNFKSLWLGPATSLLIKIGTITIYTFFPMRNKFVYSCSIKIHGLGFDENLGSMFCFLLAVEAFSLQKVEMLEEVVVRWWEVRWIWQMRQNFVSQFLQFWSAGCALCGQALSWRIGPFLLMSAGCLHCRFQCISSICWAYFSHVMSSPGFRKL